VRGDLYELRAPRDAVGHEQQGRRYGVILQSDTLSLSTVIAAPTSTSARRTPFRPEIEVNGLKTCVLLEQLSAIDAESRLGDFAGRLDPWEMDEVEKALRLVLGLRVLEA
jgi:mRNA interferase MazF